MCSRTGNQKKHVNNGRIYMYCSRLQQTIIFTSFVTIETDKFFDVYDSSEIKVVTRITISLTVFKFAHFALSFGSPLLKLEVYQFCWRLTIRANLHEVKIQELPSITSCKDWFGKKRPPAQPWFDLGRLENIPGAETATPLDTRTPWFLATVGHHVSGSLCVTVR